MPHHCQSYMQSSRLADGCTHVHASDFPRNCASSQLLILQRWLSYTRREGELRSAPVGGGARKKADRQLGLLPMPVRRVAAVQGRGGVKLDRIRVIPSRNFASEMKCLCGRLGQGCGRRRTRLGGPPVRTCWAARSTCPSASMVAEAKTGRQATKCSEHGAWHASRGGTCKVGRMGRRCGGRASGRPPALCCPSTDPGVDVFSGRAAAVKPRALWSRRAGAQHSQL